MKRKMHKTNRRCRRDALQFNGFVTKPFKDLPNRWLMRAIVAASVVLLIDTSSWAQSSSLLQSTPSRLQPSRGPLALTAPLTPQSSGTNAALSSTGQIVSVVGEPSYDVRPRAGTSSALTAQRMSPQPPSTPGFNSNAPPGSTATRQSNRSVVSPGDANYMPVEDRPTISLDGASWTYQPPPPLRVFRKNDVVTIRVDEITRVLAEGAARMRKRTLYEAILTDWIRLKDFRLRPDPQANGDPTVGTESNANFRAQSSVESRESMTFNIAATIVDIRPNGNLVLEARKAIRVNDNLWETSLSGICRAEDIGADNVVLSKDLLDLEIKKQDQGHLRDGYSRGWFQRIFDRIQPF